MSSNKNSASPRFGIWILKNYNLEEKERSRVLGTKKNMPEKLEPTGKLKGQNTSWKKEVMICISSLVLAWGLWKGDWIHRETVKGGSCRRLKGTIQWWVIPVWATAVSLERVLNCMPSYGRIYHLKSRLSVSGWLQCRTPSAMSLHSNKVRDSQRRQPHAGAIVRLEKTSWWI